MKKLKIIVEGPDRVGKDTLINAIIKHYKKNFLLLHYYATPDKENPISWGENQYHNMFRMFEMNEFILSSRGHLGEKVYPTLYAGYNGSYVDEIEKIYNTNDILLITLVDTPENLISRDDGLSHSINIILKRKEIKLFIEAHENSSIRNKMLIDVKDYDTEKLKEKVFTFIDKMEK